MFLCSCVLVKLIIGLGNPGKEYENTRHNFGFVAVLDFYTHHRADFGDWKKKFSARIAEGKFDGEKIILALPQTFMNNSGEAVRRSAKYFKIIPDHLDDIWLIHDDLDLPLGATRLSTRAGTAGHKGVESVIKTLGSQNFARFRLGIRTPRQDKVPTDQYVLEKFSKEEMRIAQEMLHKTTAALDGAITMGIARAMNSYNY